jgi:origin recognition complex subunit 3
MSHYFANSATAALLGIHSSSFETNPSNAQLCAALRRLPSFQGYVEQLLTSRSDLKTNQAKVLLDSDLSLMSFVREYLLLNKATLSDISDAINHIRVLGTSVPKVRKPISTLYIMALSGKLKDSPHLRELFLHLKRMRSDETLPVASWLMSHVKDDHALPAAARKLHTMAEGASGERPLRSGHDAHTETFRTTVVAKKIALSKQKSQLSEEDARYSELLLDFTECLREYVDRKLANPQEMLFREIMIYDIKGPHRATFAPNTRGAVERALSSPHDYLNCECCASADGGKEQVSQLNCPWASSCLINCHRALSRLASRRQQYCTNSTSNLEPSSTLPTFIRLFVPS